MESPTIRTRNGLAAVGILGLGGAVVRRRLAGATLPGRRAGPRLRPARRDPRPRPRRREPHGAAGQAVRPARDRDDVRELQGAAERGDRAGHVEARPCAACRRARPGRCAAGWARTAGTRGRRRRRRAPERAATVPAPGRPRAAPARRAGATATPRATPSPRGGAACGRRSSEAVVDEGRDADRTEGGDAEQGEAEQRRPARPSSGGRRPPADGPRSAAARTGRRWCRGP